MKDAEDIASELLESLKLAGEEFDSEDWSSGVMSSYDLDGDENEDALVDALTLAGNTFQEDGTYVHAISCAAELMITALKRKDLWPESDGAAQ